ncbi:MAG: hypothetical protein H7Y60_06520 [Rhodospirillaceae bacterium]|nr:hypothetical protein [Rhodospirillales bacterium]
MDNQAQIIFGALIVVLAVAALAVLRVVVLQIKEHGLIGAIHLMPYTLLGAIGFIATPLWYPCGKVYDMADRLFGITVRVRKVMIKATTPSYWDPRFRVVANWIIGPTGTYETALLEGDLAGAAEVQVPRAKFPWFWQAVHADMLREIWEDGVLVNNQPISHLADKHCTNTLVDNCIRGGFIAGLATAIGALIVVVVSKLMGSLSIWDLVQMLPDSMSLAARSILHDLRISGAVAGVADPLASFQPPVGDNWGYGDTVAMGVSFTFARLADSVLTILSMLFPAATSTIVLGVGVTLTMMMTTLKAKMQEYAVPYIVPTKDALTLAKSRAVDRALMMETYAARVERANTWLKDSPLYDLGEATGLGRSRGDLSAPRSGNRVVIDGEGLTFGTAISGAIGSGKTRGVLRGLTYQVLSNPRMGMFAACGKGVLGTDLQPEFEATGRMGDVYRIGTADDEYGVDIKDGLMPAESVAIMSAVSGTIAKSEDGDIWQPLANDQMGNCDFIGFALARTPEGDAWMEANLTDPNSHASVYRMAVSPMQVLWAARIVRNGLTSEENYRAYGYKYDSDSVRAAVDYVTTEWQTMAPNTRSGIVANIRSVWGKLLLSERLNDKFCRGMATKILPVSEALNSKIITSSINADRDGPAARLVLMMIKERLYFDARVRQRKIGSKACWETPCAVVLDEGQELVSVSTEGACGEVNFANLTRSTGLTLIVAFQGVASLYYRLGKPASDNFLTCLRNKLVLAIEDKETFDLVRDLSGETYGVQATEDGLYSTIEHRALATGFTPVSLPAAAYESPVTPSDFRAMRQAILDPSAIILGKAVQQDIHGVDLSNVPPSMIQTMTGPQDNITARLAAISAAQWRAEDKNAQIRSTGVEKRDVFNGTDIIKLEQGYAWAFWHRAGGSQRDIIKLATR